MLNFESLKENLNFIFRMLHLKSSKEKFNLKFYVLNFILLIFYLFFKQFQLFANQFIFYEKWIEFLKSKSLQCGRRHDVKNIGSKTLFTY